MKRLIFLVEERSMATLLDGLLPRYFPDLAFQCVPHEGKSDLERSLPRKLRGWREEGARFVVLRDSDGGDCRLLKARLAEVCRNAGRDDSLVRIVCQELEAWYLGDPEALAIAFDAPKLRALVKKPSLRNPDGKAKPSEILAQHHPTFQKIDGARALAPHLSYQRSNSASFRALIDGIARISGQPVRA